MNVQTITVGAFQENCYLVVDGRAGRAVIVDPGSEGDRLVDAVENCGATLEAIWVTHAHVDHIGAIASIKREWDVPIYLHPLDRRLARTIPGTGPIATLVQARSGAVPLPGRDKLAALPPPR